MVHWDDVKANVKELVSDLKRQKIGIIGLSLIVLMVTLGLLAPVLAPGAGEEWSPMYDRWAANPERAPPKWFDYITTTDHAHHHVEEDFEYNFTYDTRRNTEKAELTFTHDIDSDVPPQDFFFKIEGEVEELTRVRYTVERPETDWFRFSLDRAEYEQYLEDGTIAPPELREAFVDNGRQLNTDTQIPFLLDVEEYGEYFEEGLVHEDLREAFEDPPVGDPIYLAEDAELTRADELFSLDRAEYEQYLEEGHISPELRETFVEQGFTLPEETNLTEEEDTGVWWLVEEEGTEDEERLYRIEVRDDELSIRSDIEIWFTSGERDHEEIRMEIRDDNIGLFRHEYAEVSSTPNHGAPSDVEGEYFVEGDRRFEEFRIVVEDDRLDVYHYPAERYDFDEWEVFLDRNPGETGEFSLWNTLRRSGDFRDLARSVGRSYLVTYEGVPYLEIPDRHDIGNPAHVLQSQLNENVLDGGTVDVLRGEYTIRVELWGAEMSSFEFEEEGTTFEIDEDSTSITFSGAVFGLMGTDRGRRDLWQGWVHGARWGLLAGGIVAISTIVLSTLYGMTSAYYGGWVDELMSRINEIMIGIPTLPLLIIILLYWQSIWAFIILYAALMWRGAARVIRARGLQVAQDTYIEASEALGSGSGRIIRKHMIPQILPYSFAQASLLIPVVIMAEAGLHILGLGDPGIVSWGTILNEARAEGALLNPSRSWWWVLLPGLGMVMVGFGFIATGMAIERIINPKMQQR